MNVNAKKFSVLLLLLTSVLVIYLGLRMAVSGMLIQQTDLFLQDWQSKQTAPSEKAWQVAYQAITEAEAWQLVPQAKIAERKGKLYEWQAFANRESGLNADSAYQQAILSYRQQTELRPLWPYAWLNLLTAKVQLQQFDQEFETAFKQVLQTGADNPAINRLVAKLGIQAWPNLTSVLKGDVLRLIVAVASRGVKQSVNLKALMQQQDIHQMACLYARASKTNIFQLCR